MKSSKNKKDKPEHIAIICDGDRRWAIKHKWDVLKVHRHAFDKVFDPIIDYCLDHKIPYLTFWVFSTENWNRPKKEVKALMNIFRTMFEDKALKYEKKGVRVNHLGRKTRLADDILQNIDYWCKKTKNNNKLVVNFAMDYGGRDEIVRAAKKIIKDVQKKQLKVANLNEDIFSNYLDTKGIPDPDMIIRTSGEYRLSGFMSWQHQYAEFFFPKCYFPDFDPKALETLIKEFKNRRRTYGK